MNPENFKAPFTASEGWGTISQVKNSIQTQASIYVGHGKVELQNLILESESRVKTVKLSMNRQLVPIKFRQEGKDLDITFDAVSLRKGDVILAELNG